MSQTYNLVAIGAGTGGLVSAAGSAGVYAKVTPWDTVESWCRTWLGRRFLLTMITAENGAVFSLSRRHEQKPRASGHASTRHIVGAPLANTGTLLARLNCLRDTNGTRTTRQQQRQRQIPSRADQKHLNRQIVSLQHENHTEKFDGCVQMDPPVPPFSCEFRWR